MATKRSTKASIADRLKPLLAKEPGQTVKDLAKRLEVNRQFMSGYLAALEDRGEVVCRRAGPARIYFTPHEAEGT